MINIWYAIKLSFGGKMKAVQLAKALARRNAIVEVIVPDMKPFKPTNFSSYNEPLPGYAFPKHIVVLSDTYDNVSCVTLSFYDPVKQRKQVINVPSDFELIVRRFNFSEEVLKVRREFAEWEVTAGLASKLGHNFTTGADPEIFAVDKNNRVIPAFLWLPSAKEATKHPSYGNKAFWDGFQAEFDVNPGGCLDARVSHIRSGLLTVKEALRKYDKEAKLSMDTVMQIPQEMLDNNKPEHVAFGCTPSKNVYGMEGIKRDGKDVNYRTAGGHIHLGVSKDDNNEKTIGAMIKAMDAILGVAAVSLFANLDNAQRRVMYGLAGEYRTPAYGLEYRTLSNAWLCHPIATHITIDLARRAAMVGKRGLLKMWKGNEQETIHTINTHDVKKAREILERNKVFFKNILNAIYGVGTRADAAYLMFTQGIEMAVKDPKNIEHNWGLNGNSGVNHDKGNYVGNMYGYVNFYKGGDTLVKIG